jgi:PD-(D/E)XK endonuclease
MEWLGSRGALVLTPHGHSPDYDLVADLGDRLARVQVKTSICWAHDRWVVTLATRGGNRSWSGLVKRLDASRCDYLFVLVGDGRRWCIPASRLDGRTGLTLGGPKYSEFEVTPGHPLPPRTPDQPASTIVSLDPRGDVRVAKGGGL